MHASLPRFPQLLPDPAQIALRDAAEIVLRIQIQYQHTRGGVQRIYVAVGIRRQGERLVQTEIGVERGEARGRGRGCTGAESSSGRSIRL
jgi:hypothetical protein